MTAEELFQDRQCDTMVAATEFLTGEQSINSNMIPKTVDQIKSELHAFGVTDYAVFASMLLGCSGVGVWYAMRSKKSSSANAEEEYMVGGRTMAVFPVAMSLVATFISGITLIGNPTEIYLYGTEFITALLCLAPMAIIFGYLFLPVFHQLSLSSTYEYLEMRFDRSVRLLGSVLFAVSMITWLPIVIYVPALSFNQVTGINVHYTTIIVCAVCIFYTCLGGIKAVVWTDVIQTCVMVSAMVLVVMKGTYDVGGLDVLVKRAWDGDRLVFPSWSWDLTRRHTIQGLTMGALMAWLNSMLNQNMIQRYISLPSIRHARYALIIYIFGLLTIMSMGAYCGLLAYAMYYKCDPLTTKLAANRDQIVPLMVMNILGQYPGLPGLFVAGVFSASLSSLSTGLNSMAAVVLEDFVRSTLGKEFDSKTNLIIMKAVTVFVGVICLLLVVIVEQLGTIMQTAVSLGSIASGPVFGIFVCGMLIPWVNAKGALFGGISGLLSAGFVILGAQSAIADGKLRFKTKPLSVEGCDYYYNTSFDSISPVLIDDTDIFPLYKLSYMWYTPLGATITITIALLISWATDGLSTYVDPRTIAPPLRFLVAKRRKPGQVPEVEIFLKPQKSAEDDPDQPS